MIDEFSVSDDLGPFKVIRINVGPVGLRAGLVIDNVACGPSIGGIRMGADVSMTECARLARAMTFKNAAAGLPHGGGKAVIVADPKMDLEAKEALVRCMAKAIGEETDYIPGPDMGTDEKCMAWIKDEIGRAVGLPREFGGIPLDEIGATGLGIARVVEVALDYCDVPLDGARLAVQGFGAVGRNAARLLTAKGAVLVAAADSRGCVYDPDGLDITALLRTKAAGGSVTDLPSAQVLGRERIVEIPCDIWIPAAQPDVINEGNVSRLTAKLVVQGANIPLTAGAERALHQRGVLCVPDFIANAGGVICAAMEYGGASESSALAAVEEKIRRNARAVLENARAASVPPRRAAIELARQRLQIAMSLRRWAWF